VTAPGVERALRYLAGTQGRTGRFGPDFSGALYNHGIATAALLEHFARTRDPRFAGHLDRALACSLACQTPEGGWGYVGASPDANTPIAVWQIHALSLAGALGWERVRPAADRGLAWLRGVVDERGIAGYRAPRDFPYGSDSLTAMAAFYLIAHRSADEDAGREARMADAVRDAAARPAGDLDFYRCYFLSYALHATDAFDPARALQARLAGAQVRQGPHSGSWEPNDRWSVTGGRVYATALAALSLEAPCRAPRVIAMLRGGDGL
jgi:hypothetical protein